jgi:hypothetical protein
MDERKKQPEPKEAEARLLEAEELDEITGGTSSRRTEVKDTHDRYTN